MIGKSILVVGMARSGVAAAELALRRGARVVCTDLRADASRVAGTEAVYGVHRREDFLAADLVVVSPGVPAGQADVAAALAAGVRVVGELAFAAELLAASPSAPTVLAVSGTNGKSTTTHLLGQILAGAGRKVFVGGNLGEPLSHAVDGGYDTVAVEVSSYQMELPGTFTPRAAAILNLTPDHLERHGSMDGYGALKCRMFARMGPECTQILPLHEPRLVRLAAMLPGRRLWLQGAPGVTAEVDRLVFEGVHDDGPIALSGFSLPGRHNRENLAAACLLALCAGVRRDQIEVARLSGLPHRLEGVRERAGVRWINDSKATNVDSTVMALRAMNGPFVLLLGGKGKEGANYSPLASELAAARAVVCFGASGPEIAKALGEASSRPPPHTVAHGLEAAVTRAAQLARKGDVVLLSPACASFDEFTDFEHRGRTFRSLVEAL